MLNTIPAYYHWSPGTYTNMLSLLEDQTKTKDRLPLPQNNNVNYAGMVIGPKGQTLKELEQSTSCILFVRTVDEPHVMIIGKNSA